MKLTITAFLLPAALALPSNHNHNGHHGHHSGHHVSGAPLSSGIPGGPFNMGNSSASQAATGTAYGTANSITKTNYVTLQSTIYQTASDSAIASSPSNTGSPSEGGPENAGASCDGATVTVTADNTVTVTVDGSPAQSATSVAPEAPETEASQAPSVTPVAPSSTPVALSSTAPVEAPVQTTSIEEPVAPISQVPTSAQETSTPAVVAEPSTSAEALPSSSAPVSSVAASSAQAATPSSSSSSSGSSGASPPGSKRGLFIPVSPGDPTSADYVKAFNANPGKISWILNQYSGPPADFDTSKFSYVPQCYDKFSDDSKPGEAPHPWTTNAQKAVDAGEKYFLSFGEANTPNDQGFQMGPDEAVEKFMEMMQPWAEKGITIGSPTTLARPDDLQWQRDVLTKCKAKGCSIGFIGAHWFSPCGKATAQELADTFWGTIDDYKKIATEHNLKIWVDNFSLDCEASVQKDFFDIVVPKMDNEPMIERYGYVSTTKESQPNGFINSDGSISELGKYYAEM